ncbi:MAG: TraR/DksA family transcriptional regulator [Hyphomicrobium sp.]
MAGRRDALQRLLAAARPAVTRDDIRIEQLPDAVDQVQSIAERELAITQLDQLSHVTVEIQAALKRIEAGTYGVCEECEIPIAPRRLDAVPFARLCVACQQRLESNERVEDSAWDAAA